MGSQRVRHDWVTKHSTASLRSLWDYGLYSTLLFTYKSVLPIYLQTQHGPLSHISPDACSPCNQAQIFQGSFLPTLAIICWSSPDLPLQNFNRASLFSSTLFSWHLLFPSQISKKSLYICLYIHIYIYIFFPQCRVKYLRGESGDLQKRPTNPKLSPQSKYKKIFKIWQRKMSIYISYALHRPLISCVLVQKTDFFF